MNEKIIGVQLGPNSVIEEGVERVIDNLQKTAHVNTLFLYTQTYQIAQWKRGKGVLAPDHGYEISGYDFGDMTQVWVNHNEKYFVNTPLRSNGDVSKLYHGRDVLAETIEAANSRGMKVFARNLEPEMKRCAQYIPNWPKVMSIDVFGVPNPKPCWNNPMYINWHMAIVEDIFKSYDIYGYKYGAECMGPLSTVLMSGPGAGWYTGAPTCFCKYCIERGQKKGINAERAKAGYQKLYNYVRGLENSIADTRDGAAITILRIIFDYPEILAWQREQIASEEEIHKKLYGIVHAIKPNALYGVHVYHQGVSWDPIHRATLDYSDMARYTDFIKPVVYHDVAGQRMSAFMNAVTKTTFSDLDPNTALEFLYTILGFDTSKEPNLHDLKERGLSANYVYTETKRCVDKVEGKSLVLPGLGIDIPYNINESGERASIPTDTELAYECTKAIFEAGAQGLIISREYDEMRLDSLKAIGKAVEEYC